MRRSLISTLVFALGMLFVTTLSAGGHGQQLLPFHGNFAGPVLGFNMDPEAITVRCGNAPAGKVAWAIASFEGWGTATHLGRSYIYAEHCSYRPIDGAPDGTYGQGEITATAANGDVLLVRYDNGISDPQGNFMDEITFMDGGTGRFSIASGYGVEMGSVNFGDFTFAIEVYGVISYKQQ
ncbi:MAG: hypothetical protein GTO09_08375 [Candidatus Latescibacteria bacterium]|nr:hypothetical protein [Candidatus Latescibacterota bacterium]